MGIKARALVCALCAALIIALGWLLFRDIRSDGGAANGVRAELDGAAAEQSRAYDATQRVGERLDSGIERVGGIESAVRDSRDTASRIEAGIDASTERVRDSIAITQDSQRRISESLGVIQAIREGARADGK